MHELVVHNTLDLGSSLSSRNPGRYHVSDGSGNAFTLILTQKCSSSLGASHISFERGAKMAAVIVALGSTSTFSSDPSVAAWLAPQTIEVPGKTSSSKATVASENASGNTSFVRSIAIINRDLDEESIEDGVTHKAELQLAAHLERFGEEGLLDVVRLSEPQSRSAELLRLCGRASSISAKLRTDLVLWGLASLNIEVRDAAVQAVENWSDRALTKLLVAHEEPVVWLRDYAANVVRDFEA